MKYEKFKLKEEGFFLLESLVTLSILMFLILSISPLMLDWLTLHQEAKESLEANRLIYEKSMEIKNSARTSLIPEEKMLISNHRIEIREKERSVWIYEIRFDQK